MSGAICDEPPCVGCHGDHTGENIVENPDCPRHGYEEHEEQNLGSCPWYLTRGLPDSERKPCTFGCWDEPACETNEPDEGWPVQAGAICPQPGDPRCTDMTPCRDCTSLSKWEPLEPYDIEDEPPGSPIFLPGGGS